MGESNFYSIGGLELLKALSYCSALGPAALPALALVNWFSGFRVFFIASSDTGAVFAVLYLVYLLTSITGWFLELRDAALLFGKSFAFSELRGLLYLIPYALLTMIVWGFGLPILSEHRMAMTDLIQYVFMGVFVFFIANRIIFGKSLKPASAEAGFELDDSPLRAEICALARQVGVQIKSIRITPPPPQARNRKESLDQLAIRRQAWWESLNPIILTIPMDMVQGMASSTLTAGMASFLVRSEFKRSLMERLPLTRKLPRTAQHFIRSMVIVILILSLAASGFSSLIRSSSAAYLFYCLILVLCAAYLLYRLRIRRSFRTSKSILRAAKIWREADPRSERAVEDFLLEVLRFNQSLNPNIPRENLLQFNLRVESTRAFMNELDESNRQSLLSRMEADLAG